MLIRKEHYNNDDDGEENNCNDNKDNDDKEEDSVKECEHEKDVHFAVLLGLISVPDTTNEKG